MRAMRGIHVIWFLVPMLRLVDSVGLQPVAAPHRNTITVRQTAEGINDWMERQVSQDSRNTTLFAALSAVYKQARIRKYALLSELKNVPTSRQFADISLRRALGLLLNGSEYTFKVENDRFIIVPKDLIWWPQRVQAGSDIPVTMLPYGRLRSEWLVVRERHPHGRQAGWVLKNGWRVLPEGCGPIDTIAAAPAKPAPPERSYCFVRTIPSNGAVTLDWAETGTGTDRSGTDISYSAGVGPISLPLFVHREPRMGQKAAWRRVIHALTALGAHVPRATRTPKRADLRIVRDAKNMERFRLVWQFQADNSVLPINVDSTSGEVWGIDAN